MTITWTMSMMSEEDSGGVKSEETQAAEIKIVKSNHVLLRNQKQNRNQCDWRQNWMTETEVPAEWLLPLHPVPCWMDEAALVPAASLGVCGGAGDQRQSRTWSNCCSSLRRLWEAGGGKQPWSQFSSCCCITNQVEARRWNYNHTLLIVIVLTRWLKQNFSFFGSVVGPKPKESAQALKRLNQRWTYNVFSVLVSSTFWRRFWTLNLQHCKSP